MPTRMRLTDEDLLSALNLQDSRELPANFNQRSFNKKELITLPDNEEDIVFIVKSGRVRVFLAYEDKEFTLSLLEKGDVFTSHTRAFTQALDDTTLLISSTKEFSKIIANFPSFGLSIVKVLGDLLSNSISIINGLVFKDVNLRLTEFLLKAAEDKGSPTDDGLLLELGLNTEEIATLLGSSRQSVSVLLNDLYRAGVLDRKGKGKVIIKDHAKLKEMAERP